MKEQTVIQPDIRIELLRQLSQAVQSGDIADGLRLAAKAQPAMADRQDSLSGIFRRLEGELFYASGDSQKALASARMAAMILAPSGETEDLARAYHLAGKALVNLGNYREAETAFHDAESLFRRCDSISGRLDAVNQLARVYFIRAEYKNALKFLLEAVKLADQTNDRCRLAYLWGNLGRVYTFLGDFKKATETLQLNIDMSGELGDDKEMARALLSLGYVEMQAEQYEKAEKTFDQSYSLLVRERMTREIIIYRTYIGELKYRCGDLTASRRVLNDAIESARSLSPESSLLAAPLRHLAELELRCANLNAAARLAHNACILTEKIGEAVEKGAALRILAQVAEAEKATDKAAELFGQALEIFEEADARFERAETLVILAQGTVGNRRRLAYLFRAADLYQKLGCAAKQEKIQHLINETGALTDNAVACRSAAADESPTIVTTNRRMKKIIADIAHVAQSSNMPVLLIGETGSGKDLLARHYHAASGRTGRFVAVNCAAFPDTLLEAELFGYRKGAFTGAGADKEGLLHRANGGTFFLDEIGELSLASQAKLLTVLESCRTRRLGDTADEALDIRFVAATNCDLTAMVAQGTFRMDLFFRLSGISFTILPLAERPEDIPLLVRYFLQKEGFLAEDDQGDPAVIAEFASRSWPGNVRQLESEVKKLVLFSTMAREDSLGDLAGVLVQNDHDSRTTSLFNQVEQFERALIIRALRQADGNKSEAARFLAIHESTLRAKMKRYELSEAAIS